MNKVKSSDCTDSINSLLYLAIRHMSKECKVRGNNGAVSLISIYRRTLLAWFIQNLLCNQSIVKMLLLSRIHLEEITKGNYF